MTAERYYLEYDEIDKDAARFIKDALEAYNLSFKEWKDSGSK